MDRITALLRNQKGQGIVEYLMMLGVIVGVILVLGTMFKPRIGSLFQSIMDRISNSIGVVGSPQPM